MNESQIIDLDKIRELTSPLEELQAKLNKLEEDYGNFIKLYKDLSIVLKDISLMDQIQIIVRILEKITNVLFKISNENINKYLIFKDFLIKKYKESFKEYLKDLRINQETTKKIGLILIENKEMSKIVEKSSLIKAINLNQWLDILESLKLNSIFINVIQIYKKYYQSLLEKKLDNELKRIPDDINQTLLEDFKKEFLKNSDLTFKMFLKEIENKYSDEQSSIKKKIIEKTREKEKLEELKRKQEDETQSYKDYLKFSNTEFERLRRKKKREKLSDIKIDLEKEEKLEISDEISEKIEKFKSKFEDSFEDKYMIQKDDDINPLDLIRERKIKKDKEYKKFLKKFKDKNN